MSLIRTASVRYGPYMVRIRSGYGFLFELKEAPVSLAMDRLSFMRPWTSVDACQNCCEADCVFKTKEA